MRVSAWLHALILIAAIATSWSALANGVDRGGGDRYEQEFRGLGHDVAERLRALAVESKAHPLNIAPELLAIDLTAFLSTVDSTPVESTDDPVLVTVEGKPVPREAANSADEHKIWVNRPMWDAPSNTRIPKLAIALHEYLGVMRVDRAYDLSLSFRARLELEADTSRFKVELANQLKDLGRALTETFRQSFEPVFARFETMQSTPEYQRCIAPKSKPKAEVEPQVLADCFDVVAMIEMAARTTPTQAAELPALALGDGGNALAFSYMKEMYHCGWPHPRALLNWLFDKYRKWQVVCPKLDTIITTFDTPRKALDDTRVKDADAVYLAYANAQPEARKAFALASRDALVAEYNESSREVSERVRALRANDDKACPGDLADGIRCAVPLTLDAVTKEIQPDMTARRQKLEALVSGAVAGAAGYVE